MLRSVAIVAACWSIVCLVIDKPALGPLGIASVVVCVCALVSAIVDGICAILGHAVERYAILAAILAGTFAPGLWFELAPIGVMFSVFLPVALWQAEVDKPMPQLLRSIWPTIALCSAVEVPYATDIAAMFVFAAVAFERLRVLPRPWPVPSSAYVFAVPAVALLMVVQGQGWILVGFLFFAPLIIYPVARACWCAMEI